MTFDAVFRERLEKAGITKDYEFEDITECIPDVNGIVFIFKYKTKYYGFINDDSKVCELKKEIIYKTEWQVKGDE